MNINLSDHFTYKKLLRFTVSPIMMMIFTSIYSMVDGLFVSNVVGKDEFAALNLIYPVIMVLGSVGFMFGAGGTAIVSKTLGEGDKEKACKYFTLIVIVTAVSGILLGILGIVFIRPVAVLLGADDSMLPNCVLYATIILSALPFFMVQNLFQSFFIAAEKPKLGFLFTVASGVCNIILDALFVAVFRWGLAGAAIATAISQIVGGVAPLVYFIRPNTSLLRFCKTRWYGSVIGKSITNGSSELLSNIAMSLVSMVYNKRLMAINGADGVSAYGVIAYVSFVFVAIFLGYAIGTAPIVGFNYGAQNKSELQSLYGKSLKLIGIAGVAMFGLSLALATPLGYVFFSNEESLRLMTADAMRIYSLCFLFCGFNIFASSFFTALNNGLISAVLSFSRTLVFQLLSVELMSRWLGLEGIWLSCCVAEVLSMIVSVVMLITQGKRYGYIVPKRQQVVETK